AESGRYPGTENMIQWVPGAIGTSRTLGRRRLPSICISASGGILPRRAIVPGVAGGAGCGADAGCGVGAGVDLVAGSRRSKRVEVSPGATVVASLSVRKPEARRTIIWVPGGSDSSPLVTSVSFPSTLTRAPAGSGWAKRTDPRAAGTGGVGAGAGGLVWDPAVVPAAGEGGIGSGSMGGGAGFAVGWIIHRAPRPRTSTAAEPPTIHRGFIRR